jgi:hypothetical protein
MQHSCGLVFLSSFARLSVRGRGFVVEPARKRRPRSHDGPIPFFLSAIPILVSGRNRLVHGQADRVSLQGPGRICAGSADFDRARRARIDCRLMGVDHRVEAPADRSRQSVDRKPKVAGVGRGVRSRLHGNRRGGRAEGVSAGYRERSGRESGRRGAGRERTGGSSLAGERIAARRPGGALGDESYPVSSFRLGSADASPEVRRPTWE